MSFRAHRKDLVSIVSSVALLSDSTRPYPLSSRQISRCVWRSISAVVCCSFVNNSTRASKCVKLRSHRMRFVALRCHAIMPDATLCLARYVKCANVCCGILRYTAVFRSESDAAQRNASDVNEPSVIILSREQGC